MKLALKIIILVFILLLVGGSAAYYFFFQTKKGNDIVTENKLNDLQDKTPEPDEEFSKDVSEIKQSAWIPYWDFDRGYNSLVKNKDKFYSVCPMWYELKSDGSLTSKKQNSHAKLDKFAKDNGILLIPTIAAFDHQIIKGSLNTPENYQRHINGIIKIVEDNDYDGIDIDYESIELEDRDLYLKFVSDLSKELKKRNKMITVDVISKWGDDIDYPSLPQTRQSQDWEILSESVDEIRIMAYDYTSFKSKHPGPIAPLPWINAVVDYAITKIPREKIVLGAHLYAYEWVDEKFDPENAIETNPIEENVQVNAYEYSDILDIKKNYKFEEYPEDGYGEVILEYEKNNTNRIIFYINGNGVKARKELAAKFGIKGVSYWRLGGEDDSGF